MSRSIFKDQYNYFGKKVPAWLAYALNFSIIFVFTFVILYVTGLVPEQLRGEVTPIEEQIVRKITDDRPIETPVEEPVPNTFTLPERITIDKIGVDTVVYNPNSVLVNVLDQFLQKGAVYYPGSGSIERGNVFVFGHSTNWPVVQNQAYKTFNDLDKLEQGDEIEVKAKNKTYIYKVNSVKLVDANEALVTFSEGSRTLTLATCNTFGRKQDRWLVEASFVKSI